MNAVEHIESDSQLESSPLFWVITLGLNNSADTIECINSLKRLDYSKFHILYIDNGSREEEFRKVATAFEDIHIIRMAENVGMARGFNAGIAHALAQGAEYVFMINNDTIVDRGLLRRLADAGERDVNPTVLVPKIYYYDDRDVIWSAGSRFRSFPPAIVIRKGTGPDDGRFDEQTELSFTTTCALAFPRRTLESVGLLDANFFFFCEDYDYCLRAREAGVTIRFVPDAKMWHKVSKSTRAGSKNPFFWHTYGRSEAIFCRKHRKHRLMTGLLHRIYLVARLIAEGKSYGVASFLRGWRDGARAEIKPVPVWNDPSVDRGEVVR